MKSKLLIIPFFALVFSCFSCATYNYDLHDSTVPDTFDLQGHRGARGNRSENTWPAFAFAIDQNITTLELDINITKDKKLVIHHDSALNPSLCTALNGDAVTRIPIRDLTLAELQKLDFGSSRNPDFPQQELQKTGIITLDELFQLVVEYEKTNEAAKKVRFNIELKIPSDAGKPAFIEEMVTLTVKTIEDHTMVTRSIIQSVELEALPLVKKLNKDILLSALMGPRYFDEFTTKIELDAYRYDMLEKAINAGADFIAIPYTYINAEFVQKCHEQNMKVLPWTVNNEKLMFSLFTDNVDGIISDYPLLLIQSYKKWKTDTK